MNETATKRTVYTLLHSDKGICGVFENEESLCASLSSLKHLNPEARFEANKILLGSNIVVNHLSHDDIESTVQKLVENVNGKIPQPIIANNSSNNSDPTQEKPRHQQHPCAPGEVLVKIPAEIKSEVNKVKQRYEVFLENYKTFRRLLRDKVVRLDMKTSMVPDLFRDKFYIFRDIVLNKVPDEDAFSYFMDRYIPNYEDHQFVLETINEINNSSDDGSDDDDDSEDDDDDDDNSSNSSHNSSNKNNTSEGNHHNQ